MLFVIGDYLAGMMVGALTAIGVRAVIWPGMDMVVAMIVGMAIGMAIHLVFGLILAPLIGMFNAMIPASLIGMYGGMFFGMRDSMAAGSRTLRRGDRGRSGVRCDRGCGSGVLRSNAQRRGRGFGLLN